MGILWSSSSVDPLKVNRVSPARGKRQPIWERPPPLPALRPRCTIQYAPEDPVSDLMCGQSLDEGHSGNISLNEMRRRYKEQQEDEGLRQRLRGGPPGSTRGGSSSHHLDDAAADDVVDDDDNDGIRNARGINVHASDWELGQEPQETSRSQRPRSARRRHRREDSDVASVVKGATIDADMYTSHVNRNRARFRIGRRQHRSQTPPRHSINRGASFRSTDGESDNDVAIDQAISRALKSPSRGSKTWSPDRSVAQRSPVLSGTAEQVGVHSFDILKALGKGGFGLVLLVREKTTGLVYALKMISKRRLYAAGRLEAARILNERVIMSTLDYPFICKLYYSFQTSTHLYMVLEFVEGGDIDHILEKDGIVSESVARLWMAQIVLALGHLHAHGYVHRDVKPGNIMISAQGNAKLMDFGLARRLISSAEDRHHEQRGWHRQLHGRDNHRSLDNRRRMDLPDALFLDPGTDVASPPRYLDLGPITPPSTPPTTFRPSPAQSPAGMIQNPLNAMQDMQEARTKGYHKRAFSLVGTPEFLAPEALRRSGYAYEVDWWALGVTLHEMLFGEAPFQPSGANNNGLYEAIVRADITQSQRADTVSQDARDLLIGLLQKDPRRRLGYQGVTEVMAHPWFRGVDWDMLERTVVPLGLSSLSSDVDVDVTIPPLPQLDAMAEPDRETDIEPATVYWNTYTYYEASKEGESEGDKPADTSVDIDGFSYTDVRRLKQASREEKKKHV